MFDGSQDHRGADRNAQHRDALLRLAVEPRQHGPQILYLLRPGHAVRVLLCRGPASSLIPVRDEEILFQLQKALKLRDFVQHRQGGAALDDEQWRESRACGAEANALT